MKMVTAISLAVNTLCRYKSHEVAALQSGEDSRRSCTNRLAHLAQFWHSEERLPATRSDTQRH